MELTIDLSPKYFIATQPMKTHGAPFHPPVIAWVAYERADCKPTNLGAIVFLGIALQRLHCYRFIDFC